MHRAFVTGGSGFIGRRLIGRLLIDGWHVTALVHSSAVDANAGGILQTISFDTENVGRILQSCDVLFHAAAYIPNRLDDWHEFDRCWKINALLTAELTEL